MIRGIDKNQLRIKTFWIVRDRVPIMEQNVHKSKEKIFVNFRGW